jgi:hypothetical protein
MKSHLISGAFVPLAAFEQSAAYVESWPRARGAEQARHLPIF